MSGSIIVDGLPVEVKGADVRTYREHGMEFTPDNSAVARRERARWLCFHSTASERVGLSGAKRFFESMLSRAVPLSVEFLITNEGIIWQFCDPALIRCKHCSRINDISIGVEVSGYLWDHPSKKVPEITKRRMSYRSPPLDKGWKPTLFSYLPEQQASANALSAALCDSMGIPRRVELDPWTRRPRDYFETGPGGICGHLHAASLQKKNPKIDPGPKPLQLIAAHLGV